MEKTQNKISESALLCLAEKGLHKVTLNDIATHAGVSRPTVYSYFKDKNAIIQFALMQSAYSISEEITAYAEKFSTPRERVLESMLFTLKRLPQESYLALLSDPAIGQLVNEYALVSEEGNSLCQKIFKVILMEEKKNEAELNEIIELCTRLLLSLLTIKPRKSRNQKEQRAFLERRLLPALGL
jgi:AcrR family transcriptional regulator